MFSSKVKTLFSVALLVVCCGAISAQAQSTFSFKNISYTGDLTFTQLLGINNAGTIAGYHGATINKGFVLTLPLTFTNENFPNSAQTQVIGINNKGNTDGFYIDNAGVTHGFLDTKGVFTTVDFAGTTFNQLLGLNDASVASGYYADAQGNDHAYTYTGGKFTLISTPGVSAQATGINNENQISGFYVDTAGINHGFLITNGTLATLDYPGATFTQALGVNNLNEVVGTYMDAAGNTHGFLYDVTANVYESVNDPSNVDNTVINGINDEGQIVGFFTEVTSGNTHGLVATLVRCTP